MARKIKGRRKQIAEKRQRFLDILAADPLIAIESAAGLAGVSTAFATRTCSALGISGTERKIKRLKATETERKSYRSLCGIWANMLRRCLNPSSRSYNRYGGRGITVCDRWLDRDNFLADMAPRPDGMSIERIDNNGNYEPGNCKWATRLEQGQNTRKTRLLTFRNRTMSASAWAREIGLTVAALSRRIKSGWPEDKILDPTRRVGIRGLGTKQAPEADALVRCDREITEILNRPDVLADMVPAWLVTLGVCDWECEKRLIREAGE